MLMTVLISPGSGFQIIGLFANSADAHGFEGPSLTDFRNRLSKLDPLMGPVASAYQAHIIKLTLRPITAKARF